MILFNFLGRKILTTAGAATLPQHYKTPPRPFEKYQPVAQLSQLAFAPHQLQQLVSADGIFAMQ